MTEKTPEGIAGRLRKTAGILEIQADLASRIAATYAPDREKWEQGKDDERLTAMLRYQLDQEALARSLSKDAAEAREAADLIDRLTHPDLKAERDALVEVITTEVMKVFRNVILRDDHDWHASVRIAALRALQSGAAGEVGK